jgi:glycosyltransferase involved in cell wall biosynthesis
MGLRIYYDGLNLALQHGTGIATYTRMLMNNARDSGHSVSAVYSVPGPLSKNAALREISFYDPHHAAPFSRWRWLWFDVRDQFRSLLFDVEPVRIEHTGIVLTDNFLSRMPVHDDIFAVRNLFGCANWHFRKTRRFTNLKFDTQPDIFHCTYQMPLRCQAACNVFTIHDLVALRLPFATKDNKKFMYQLLRGVAARADHIVTVSENSKRDIMKYLDVEEHRITNTYESVEFPRDCIEKSTDAVADELEAALGLEYGKYLLFYGALEPKKNVSRLIDAYFFSGVKLPLVLVTSGGWDNEAEVALIERWGEQERANMHIRQRIYRLHYVSQPMLVTIIRGACALIFPSLYEGFGLPVLEAMLLGTPVVTSRLGSLAEVAGDAASLVNPYEVSDIARGIVRIVEDADLRAELSTRGRMQAAVFSAERYRERVAQLYSSLR